VTQETLDAMVALTGLINAGICHGQARRAALQPDYPKG
jgi:hypothetical protein